MILKTSILQKNKQRIKKNLTLESVNELQTLRAEWLRLYTSAIKDNLIKSANLYKIKADMISEVINEKEIN